MLAGSAAGPIVCAVVVSIVVALFARMRLSRPRAVALDFLLPVLMNMPAVFVVIGQCRLVVVRWLVCCGLSLEY